MPATETATPLLQVAVSQAVNFSQVRYRQFGHYSGDQTGLIAMASLKWIGNNGSKSTGFTNNFADSFNWKSITWKTIACIQYFFKCIGDK